jgi:levanase
MIAWMNNWQYANDIPTGQWRSAMALPRELSLQTIDGRPKLVSEVTPQVEGLSKSFAAVTVPAGAIAQGQTALPVQNVGAVYRVDAVLKPGTASSFGLALRTSSDGAQSTPLVYDTASGSLSLDRRASGDVSFNQTFASVETAPVALDADGRLRLEIYVDNASVQAFAQGGSTTITDQVFPDPSSTGISLVSNGGSAEIESLTITPLYGGMYDPQPVLPNPGVPTPEGVNTPGAAGASGEHRAGLAATGLSTGLVGTVGALLLAGGALALWLRGRGRSRIRG